jgi:hypothetical protein
MAVRIRRASKEITVLQVNRGGDMSTIADAIEKLQKAEEVLQEVLDEATLAYFAEPISERTELAATRMLEIGPLLYDRPRDFLHISLWEGLKAIHPETEKDAGLLESFVRPDVWPLSVAVTEKTTWDEFEARVERLRPVVQDKPHLMV